MYIYKIHNCPLHLISSKSDVTNNKGINEVKQKQNINTLPSPPFLNLRYDTTTEISRK